MTFIIKSLRLTRQMSIQNPEYRIKGHARRGHTSRIQGDTSFILLFGCYPFRNGFMWLQVTYV